MGKLIQELKIPTEKKKVILRGPMLTQSGYGVHARQIARSLFKRADEVQDIEIFTEPLSWGATPWLVDSSAENGLAGRVMQRAHKSEDDEYDVSIQLQLPNEWNPFLADKNIGVTAAVEADKCNPAWVEACNRMDLVVVPSEFSKRALESGGELTTEVKVIPEAFPDEILSVTAETEPLPLNLTTDFNFLVFGQVTGNNPENDRKNLAYTIKWMCEEFAGNPDIGIVVKTNMGRYTNLDKINSTAMLQQLVLQVSKPGGPKVYLLHGEMNNEEVARLYRHPKIKALVSLTRGEGFGLPLLEAAASDLPVIVTDWSAHKEFLNQGKFIKLDYSLVTVDASRVDNQIWMQGARWANPKEADVKRKLSKFVKSPQLPREWAKELGAKLRESHSFEKIHEAYLDLLDEGFLT